MNSPKVKLKLDLNRVYALREGDKPIALPVGSTVYVVPPYDDEDVVTILINTHDAVVQPKEVS